jgi:SulP family sulfate permease
MLILMLVVNIERRTGMINRYIGDLKREFAGYNFSKLLQDLLAGVTVAAVALPLALAFGISSGADAAAGLVTAIIGGFLMSLLSGASYQISGPTGAMTAVLIAVVAKYQLHGMFVTCLIAGAMLLLCGVFRLGRLVDYIPIPVITGFTSGIALVIALGQIDNLFGTTSAGESIVQKLGSYFALGFHINWANLLIGLGAIAVMLVWPKSWGAKVPASLAAIVAAILAVVFLKPDIPTVGKIPQSILLDNRLNLGALSLKELPLFLSPAFSVAALAMIESLLCASSAARMKKEGYDADRELLSQGLGNMILPFFGGVPATAAIARTSVAIKSGGQTRLTGVFHSLVLLLCVFVLSPLFENLPLSALSGVLIVTAWRMNDWENIRQYFGKRMKGPIIKYFVTMAATVVFDLTLAIILGIAVALIVFVYRVSKLEITSSRVENGKLHLSDADVEGPCGNAVVVYVAGPMFFMNSKKLVRALEGIGGYDTVILSIRGVPLIDISAISALSDYCDACAGDGVELIICGAQDKVLEKLKTCELYDKIGGRSFYRSVDRFLMNLCCAH